MVIKDVYLETVCGITSIFPENPYEEVAFAGKSNVGKSSLINSLINRKALARTSSQPGKTQTINFYNVNEALYLVDLPGYGYARANVEIKAKWGRMIERYLHTSKQLKAVFLLIDIRHDPSENDRMMYEWMVFQGFAPIIIATKADKINRSQLPKHIMAIREGLGAEPETRILPFSAQTKQGREEIWEVIEELTLSAGDRNRPVSGAADADRQAGGASADQSRGTDGASADGKAGSVSASATPRTDAAGGDKNEAGTAGDKNIQALSREKRKKPRWKDIGRENPAKKRAAAKAKRARKKK